MSIFQKGMTDVLKRADRIQRERLKKQKQMASVRKLQAGMAVSSLLLLGMGQVAGGTYGAFTDAEDYRDQLKACEVFPATIEKMLEELRADLTELSALDREVFSVKLANHSIKIKEVPSGADSEKISSIAASLDGDINDLQTKISQTQEQLGNVEDVWARVDQGLTDLAVLVNEIQFNKYYHPNCLEIDHAGLLNGVTNEVNKLSLLDTHMKNSIGQLIKEYRQMKNLSDHAVPELSPSVQFSGESLLNSEKHKAYQELKKSFADRIDELNVQKDNTATRQAKLYKLADEKFAEEEKARLAKEKEEEEKKRAEEEKLAEEQKKAAEKKEKVKEKSESAPEEKVEQPVEEEEVVKEAEEVIEEPVEEEPVKEEPVEEVIEEPVDTPEEEEAESAAAEEAVIEEQTDGE
ncbi:hypothetical protein [Jeotgalibacillus salarius]|uniref:Uncharacterized protein n=1 Tax=Jeotgalibacillus salarius TaxID=546023 RepID=A0A4Y8LM45_9BACL|nr:hypothetical protein [Jeotgalibacillus salarius]TFE04016.1 hypothetical protein E2626_01420 [Jeotgalibacillus salarius]